MAFTALADLCAIFTITTWLQVTSASYLGYPRIHFSGHFRADVNIQNNNACRFRLNASIDSSINGDGSYNGTNEFELFNAYVTAVVNNSGKLLTQDAIVGRYIIGNLRKPYAKLADLDVDAQGHSTVYGMKLGIAWDNSFPDSDKNVVFHGNLTRWVTAQNLWKRVKCANPSLGDTQFGAQSTTILTGIRWNNNSRNSAVLSQLKNASGGGNLAVRLTMHYYTFGGQNATLGYVLGVIGVPGQSDTLNVPGERAMNFTDEAVFEKSPCSDFDPGMYIAPFEVEETMNEVRVDLSNSLPFYVNNNSLIDLGTLQLGLLTRENEESCVLLLGSESGLPYLSDNDLPITSGIYTIKVESSITQEARFSPFVVAKVVENTDHTKICGESMFSMPSSHSVKILLQEYEYYIRPNGYYVARLDRQDIPFVDQVLLVTQYGSPVEGKGVAVNIIRNPFTGSFPIPSGGVVSDSAIVSTNSNGMATFRFQIGPHIPPMRNYTPPLQCDDRLITLLPIDGQVYFFAYSLSSKRDSTYSITIAIRAFSDVTFGNRPTWVDDIKPILSLHAQIAPIMKAILDMSSFTDVTKPQNINLLSLALQLDFDNPSHMPTTRNLSPAKRDVILRWLENPIYDNSSSSSGQPESQICVPPPMSLPNETYFIPLRCREGAELRFDQNPQDQESYYRNIYTPFPDTDSSILQERPLFGVSTADNSEEQCTRENIMKQLQTAVQLEWATIPTYLTSLYSIVDDCNTEIYNLIRSVIIQEMLHMTLSANLLIAMNGRPLIDDASVTPQFPTRLPGGVLPRLLVHLEKFSLAHTYQVFMGIEVPEETQVTSVPSNLRSNRTIGTFYDEIRRCIESCESSGKGLFDSTTLPRQVRWPWTPSSEVGIVIPITDTASAVRAINTIVDQGEGASPLDPDQIGNSNELAHFFKFEEVVCQRHLEKLSNNTYGYTGPSIPFQPEGVWPMRKNPSIKYLPQNCVTESRVFHTGYRKLLKKLQEVFDGKTDEIFTAVELMESLQVHAKRLMWTRAYPDSTDDTTCGPVWDYDWPLPNTTISDLVLEQMPDSSSYINSAPLALLSLLFLVSAIIV